MLSVAKSNPALILAIAACGSQYRFETQRGLSLFEAAQLLLLDDLRQQKYINTPALAPAHIEHRERESESQKITPRDRTEELTELIQVSLLLTIFATWGSNSDILQELLALQGVFASMLHEHGLEERTPAFQIDAESSDDNNWHRWVTQERARRTKLVASAFHNSHCLMYNTAPLILSSDIKLNLPCPTPLWKASNAAEWRLAYDSNPSSEIPFQTAFRLLFSPAHTLPASISFSTPLGNHVLMHAILQQIYFARQLYVYPPVEQLLRNEDLSTLEDVLHNWKLRWQQTPESSTNPRNPAGPIAFTSTSFLGQAYIRLYLDIGPFRALKSLRPAQIAETLMSAPPIRRTPGLVMALLHAIHGLSIPVRLGVEFVARTHSLYWSVQHSLSGLEYAFLLSRWLLTLPSCGSVDISEHEKQLFLWIKRIIEEADLANECPMEGHTVTELTKDAAKMTQVACTIIRIWARTFKGNSCWGIVDVVGSSLDIYANLLEGS
ncbi:uncharacterized protein AB675_1651 [Cyphellophora attinorum]|uniref:Xylanolytic transcriptional activator regulatory domain-containing protein n=1 Tax=Cyphellophora attinorum TaxID=1664694 RepID=A0A0N1HIQ2_9EURO|nr:uncharacterized protein AB675_1651 [Phialophora attinorum]KPI36027.1 hypothetical protein AB675_1651 [Phialophora attinorum]